MKREDYEAVLTRFDLPDMSSMLVPDQADEIPRLLKLAYHRPPPVPGFALKDAYTHLFGAFRDQRRGLLEDLISYLDEPRPPGGSVHPTLILWGEHDELFPLELAHRLCAKLGARAQLEIIKGTAHAPIVEDPKAVTKAMQKFLRGVS